MAGILVAGVLAVGCKDKETVKAAASASASASSAPQANVDQKLLEQLQRIVKTCKVDAKHASVNCPQGDQRTLVSEFVLRKRAPEKAVATFAAALQDKSTELQTVAANILYVGFRSPWGEKLAPGAVPPSDANALVRAALAVPAAQRRQALPAAVHAAMLAKQEESLFEALDKSPHAEVRAVAYRYVMTHGRMAAFEKVKELSKAKNMAVVLAALEAPRNMPAWTSEEQAALCPWATMFLSDERAAVVTKATAVLGQCSGEHIDRLLTIAEEALDKGAFTPAQVSSLRDLCAPHQRKRGTGASEKQCERTRELLGQVVVAKAATVQTRSAALVAMAYQWPDAQTLKVAKKLEKDSDKTVAEHARRTVQRLDARLDVRSKPGGKQLARVQALKRAPAPRSAPAAPAAKAAASSVAE